jgi:hypothetical protein
LIAYAIIPMLEQISSLLNHLGTIFSQLSIVDLLGFPPTPSLLVIDYFLSSNHPRNLLKINKLRKMKRVALSANTFNDIINRTFACRVFYDNIKK